MKRILIILILFFLIGQPAWSATYYVKTGGNDSLSGLDDTNAWETISKVTSTAASGDTVKFRSQDTWTGTPPVLTTTAGVTYDGCSYGTYTDCIEGHRATLQATGKGTGYGVVSIMQSAVSTPVIFQGFKVDSNSNSVGGIYVGDGSPSSSSVSYVTVTGNEVLNGITSDSPQAWYYGIIIGQNGGGTTSNVTVTNNHVHDTGHEGITVYPSGDSDNPNTVDTVLIRNNEIDHCGLAGGDSKNPLDVSNHAINITCEFNYIHDNAYAAGFTVTTFPTVAYGTPENIVFRYNIVANNPYGGFSTTLMGPMNGDTFVYGNLFINNGIHIGPGNYASKLMKFYNNVVYCPTITDFWGCGGIYETATNTSGIEFKNNIFNCDQGLCFYDYGGLIGSGHANNMYYKASVGNVAWINNTYYNTTTNPITNWEATAKVTDPTFTGGTLPTGFSGTYGTNMVPNTTYFSISTGDAIGNGATLGSPYNSAINYAGVATPLTRPAGAYDIGAYQYTGVGAYPASSGGKFIGGLLIQ